MGKILAAKNDAIKARGGSPPASPQADALSGQFFLDGVDLHFG